MGTIPKGTEYIKTVPFFLKIAEFVSSLFYLNSGRLFDKQHFSNIQYS